MNVQAGVRLIIAAGAVATIVATTWCFAPPASASTGLSPKSITVHSELRSMPRAAAAVYSVQYVTKSSRIVNYSNELARCVAGSPGVSCVISRTVAATNNFGVDLGVTVPFVAGKLGVSSSSTTSVSVSCASPPLAAGRHFSAYPVGTQWGYRVLRSEYHSFGSSTTISRALTAYRADNAVYCTVG